MKGFARIPSISGFLVLDELVVMHLFQNVWRFLICWNYFLLFLCSLVPVDLVLLMMFSEKRTF